MFKDFIFYIIEFCDNTIIAQREQYYINKIKPSYNIITVTEDFIGYTHSEEVKKRLSLNYSEERREKIRLLNKNKSLSSHTKFLLSLAALNRDERIKEKIKEASTKFNEKMFGDSVLILDIITKELIIKVPSITKASEYTKVHMRTLRRKFKNNEDQIKLEVNNIFKSNFSYKQNMAYFVRIKNLKSIRHRKKEKESICKP